MKTKQITTRWLGLVLAAGALTFASSAEAARPVKPPPPPPPPAPGAPTYRIVPLGLLGVNSVASVAFSINESGWIVGGDDWDGAFVVIPEPSVNGPVYYRDTNPADGFNDLMIPLPGTVPGYRSHGAYGINDAGIIAGTTWVGVPYKSDVVSTIWMGNTVISVTDPLWLPTLYSFGFNNSGMVLGWRYGSSKISADIVLVVPEDSNADGVPDTWFKDVNGDAANDLCKLVAPAYNPWPDAPEPAGYFEPMALNDAGQIILRDQGGVPGGPTFLVTPDYTDADGDDNPWFADANGDGLNDLMVTLVSGYGSNINSLGQIVGGADDGRPARWDIVNGTQTITYLGALSKTVTSIFATAINDKGVVVGYSSMKNGSRELFLYYKGTAYNQAACLVNPTGWVDLWPNDLNEQGVITGYGHFNGVSTAFVLVPVTQP